MRLPWILQKLYELFSSLYISKKQVLLCTELSSVMTSKLESDITAPSVCFVPLLLVCLAGRLKDDVNACKCPLSPPSELWHLSRYQYLISKKQIVGNGHHSMLTII